MNKHILRLAEKSGLIKYEFYGNMEEVEAFAKLIVTECTDILCAYQLTWNNPATVSHPIIAIERHFEMQTPSKVERLEKENRELRKAISYLELKLMIGDKG